MSEFPLGTPRFRLIPTRQVSYGKWSKSWYLDTLEAAREEAQAFKDEYGIPVLIVETTTGLAVHRGVVGADPKVRGTRRAA